MVTQNSIGVGGTLTSSDRYDSIKLICTVANNEWVRVSMCGNPTPV